MSEAGTQSGVRNLRVVREKESGFEDLVEEYLDSLGGRSDDKVEA